MKYFAFYGLEPTLQVDEAELKKQYYAKSRSFHPDFHTLEGEDAQAEALRQSTLNNEAYATLKDWDKRIAYMLREAGVLTEESGNQVPQGFLFEMMEVNEQLADLMDADTESLKVISQDINDRAQALEAEISPLMQKKALDDSDWQSLKDYYLKRKYILRLREKLNTFASAL